MTGAEFVFMISHSGWMIRLVLLILIVMSILSWSLIFFKSSQLNRARKRIYKDLTTFKVQSSLQVAVKHLDRTPDSPSFMVATEGIKEVNRLMEIKWPNESRDRIILDSVRYTLQEEVKAQTEGLYGALSFLGTCTTSAPLLGLFGTVWGIMNSFHGFKGLTTSSLSAVAPGLAEALITTVLGLIVAIPAALVHNVLMRKVELLEIRLVKFASAFLYLVERELIGHWQTKPLSQPDEFEDMESER